MGALEEQARFFVAKYGTAAGPVGGPSWSPASLTIGPEAIMVLLGLILFGIIGFTLIKDYFANREGEERQKKFDEEYERDYHSNNYQERRVNLI